MIELLFENIKKNMQLKVELQSFFEPNSRKNVTVIREFLKSLKLQGLRYKCTPFPAGCVNNNNNKNDFSGRLLRVAFLCNIFSV